MDSACLTEAWENYGIVFALPPTKRMFAMASGPRRAGLIQANRRMIQSSYTQIVSTYIAQIEDVFSAFPIRKVGILRVFDCLPIPIVLLAEASGRDY